MIKRTCIVSPYTVFAPISKFGKGGDPSKKKEIKNIRYKSVLLCLTYIEYNESLIPPINDLEQSQCSNV